MTYEETPTLPKQPTPLKPETITDIMLAVFVAQ
jgi:hypothetical protein